MPDSDVARVVHVVPQDISRGAQAYARALRETLMAPTGTRHEIMTIFAGPPAILNAERPLDVPSGWWRRIGFDPVALLRVRQTLRAARPTVVVAHGGEALKYTAPVLPRGCPLVYNKIGMNTFGRGAPLRRRLYSGLVARADAVCAVSEEAAAEAIAELRVPAERVRVLPNGRDPDVFHPGPGAGAVGHRPRLVFVGHMSPEKRPELFVEVVATLRARGVSCDGVLIGGGAPPTGLAEAAAMAGVELLGRRDDVADQLRAADVLLLTSTTEGMPGVVIEAGLSGLPVVATRVPGVGAVVEDGVTGYIVGIDDTDALVDATQRLVVDAELRTRMGEAALRRCLDQFTMAASAQRWDDLLEGLVAGTHDKVHRART